MPSVPITAIIAKKAFVAADRELRSSIDSSQIYMDGKVAGEDNRAVPGLHNAVSTQMEFVAAAHKAREVIGDVKAELLGAVSSGADFVEKANELRKAQSSKDAGVYQLVTGYIDNSIEQALKAARTTGRGGR